ncbi:MULTISPECIES: DUF6262 family protein [unclassified Cryobacterium]|uniref:DUF6262 family protein n=1 Tax=unclassified Cryobacterium TaxID=2649013 RepID=UPI0004E67AC3|nr:MULTISPECIES: DUF6262 family protein [unclassified Cryobacterium]KFF58558.1 hypothetical protein JF66_17675 [Cryobacterium sp. MLB-32]TFD04108.1 hypothetical protein E3T29_15760 [Cryobacterium sp. TMT1-66-1]TFD10548.1 hypothetical protein E3T35_12475 [Cryobacterium sp. TMT1-2-2]
MTNSSTEGLRAHHARVSLSKQEAVLAAINTLADQDAIVSVAAVARTAGVSREFIHSHTELHTRVKQLTLRQSAAQLLVQSDQADLDAGRSADKSTLMRKVLRQRAEIEDLLAKVAKLEAGRARYLGEQLLLLDASPRVDNVETIVTMERLQTDNGQLRGELDEAMLLIARLRDDLGGARLALAQALTTGDLPSGVVSIERPRNSRSTPSKPSSSPAL